MKRMLMLGVVTGLLMVACGGDSAGDATTTTATAGGAAAPTTTVAATQPQDDGVGATTTAPAAGSDGATSDGDVNVAVITIGDRTFEFDVTPGSISRCDPDFFGAFWALGGGLDMLVVAEDDPNHDAPYVKVTDPDDRDVEWWASPDINESLMQIEVPAGQSQVDSFTVDGNSITGTATFIEKSALTMGGEIPASIPGTFEVTCEEG